MFTPYQLAIIEPLLRNEIETLRRERDAYGDPDMDPMLPVKAKRMRIMPGTTIPMVRAHRRRCQAMIDARMEMLDIIETAQGEHEHSTARAA